MPVRINGATSGSVTLDAPATGSNVTLTLPGVTDTLMRQGGGKILQIVRATDSTNRSTTSTSLVDVTGMSVTISPQRSDSAIIVVATFFSQNARGSSGDCGALYALTDASNNTLSGASNAQTRANSVTLLNSYVNIWGYSTPATTSAITYKLRFQAVAGGMTTDVLNGTNTGQLFAIEVSA